MFVLLLISIVLRNEDVNSKEERSIEKRDCLAHVQRIGLGSHQELMIFDSKRG
jgi:hypothetical protein